MDLGACPKSHTERLKTEFLAAREANPSDPVFAKFQTEYENNIFAFVDECDRRIRTAQRRLEKTPEENAKTTNLVCAAGFLIRQRLTTCRLCRCVKLLKSSWQFRAERKKLRPSVRCLSALLIRLSAESVQASKGRWKSR